MFTFCPKAGSKHGSILVFEAERCGARIRRASAFGCADAYSASSRRICEVLPRRRSRLDVHLHHALVPNANPSHGARYAAQARSILLTSFRSRWWTHFKLSVSHLPLSPRSTPGNFSANHFSATVNLDVWGPPQRDLMCRTHGKLLRDRVV